MGPPSKSSLLKVRVALCVERQEFLERTPRGQDDQELRLVPEEPTHRRADEDRRFQFCKRLPGQSNAELPDR